MTARFDRLQPLARDFFVRLRVFVFCQRPFHIVQMGFYCRAGRLPIPLHQGIMNRTMLIEKRISYGFFFLNKKAIVEHTFAQQLEHGPHHMQHHNIVAGFDDGEVKLSIKHRLFCWIAL